MPSAIAMILFVVFQLANLVISTRVASEFGNSAGIGVFALLFIISSIVLGKFAARRLIITHEDQQREKDKSS